MLDKHKQGCYIFIMTKEIIDNREVITIGDSTTAIAPGVGPIAVTAGMEREWAVRGERM